MDRPDIKDPGRLGGLDEAIAVLSHLALDSWKGAALGSEREFGMTNAYDNARHLLTLLKIKRKEEFMGLSCLECRPQGDVAVG